MKKNMYSLMLSEHIIKEIDKICKNESKTRSSLINEILAEKLNLQTPQDSINIIFDKIYDMFKLSELECLNSDNAYITLKKALNNYKYKPTLNYELYIYKNHKDRAIGELRLSLRTTSKDLIKTLDKFLMYFNIIEKNFIENLEFELTEYEKIDYTKYKRIFIPLDNNMDYDKIADYLGKYINILNIMLSKFLDGCYITLDDMIIDYKNCFEYI